MVEEDIIKERAIYIMGVDFEGIKRIIIVITIIKITIVGSFEDSSFKEVLNYKAKVIATFIRVNTKAIATFIKVNTKVIAISFKVAFLFVIKKF